MKEKFIFPLSSEQSGTGGGGGGGGVGDFVPLGRTIAGISLEHDIPAQDLTNALVLATNAEVDNLF